MLPCGCLPTLEGGYGDDGTHTRDSMEWCATHGAAKTMAALLHVFVFGLTYERTRGPLQGDGKYAAWDEPLAEARALLATLPPLEHRA